MKRNLLACVMLFILFGSVGVMAGSYIFSASEIKYDNTESGSSTDIQSAIDEVYEKKSKCPDGKVCINDVLVYGTLAYLIATKSQGKITDFSVN